jgi:ribosomal protein S18 acetylase RimI-like enzyme
VVRPARPSDDIAPLLYESASASYDLYFGGRERALRKLRAIARRPGHIAGYEACIVGERDGQVVGVLAGCPIDDYDAKERRSHVLAFGHSAPWRWPAMIRVIRLDGSVDLYAPPDSWYVDALAVAPDARRRGLGHALLAAAEEQARAAGCASLALDTAVANEPARALYESFGMVAGEPVPAGPATVLGATGGAMVPYVKALRSASDTRST